MDGNLTTTRKPYTTREWVILTLPTTLVIIGVIGNVFTFIVVLRPQLRNRIVTPYLMALAILDTMFLLSNTMLHTAIDIGFDLERGVQAQSDAGCAIVKYVIVASRAMSAWVLVVFSVERLLAVALPVVQHSMNTRLRALISIGTVVIIVGLFYTYVFKLLRVNEWGYCTFTEDVWNKRYNVIINIFDFLFYSFAPSVIMAVCNSILIYMLIYSESLRKNVQNDTRGMVITIILLNITFIMLTTPMTVYQIFYVAGVDLPGIFSEPFYLYPILYSLDILNHAINFILYGVANSGFRKEILSMFGCSRWSVNSTSSRPTSQESIPMEQGNSAGKVKQGYTNPAAQVDELPT